MRPLQRAGVQSLAGELRSHKPRGAAKEIKNKNKIKCSKYSYRLDDLD